MPEFISSCLRSLASAARLAVHNLMQDKLRLALSIQARPADADDPAAACDRLDQTFYVVVAVRYRLPGFALDTASPMRKMRNEASPPLASS